MLDEILESSLAAIDAELRADAAVIDATPNIPVPIESLGEIRDLEGFF